MPQAVHSAATYANNSSDENSSVGSDATNIKEEPIEPQEYRRLAAAVTVNGGQFIGGKFRIYFCFSLLLCKFSFLVKKTKMKIIPYMQTHFCVRENK